MNMSDDSYSQADGDNVLGLKSRSSGKNDRCGDGSVRRGLVLPPGHLTVIEKKALAALDAASGENATDPIERAILAIAERDVHKAVSKFQNLRNLSSRRDLHIGCALAFRYARILEKDNSEWAFCIKNPIWNGHAPSRKNVLLVSFKSVFGAVNGAAYERVRSRAKALQKAYRENVSWRDIPAYIARNRGLRNLHDIEVRAKHQDKTQGHAASSSNLEAAKGKTCASPPRAASKYSPDIRGENEPIEFELVSFRLPVYEAAEMRRSAGPFILSCSLGTTGRKELFDAHMIKKC